MIKMVTEDQPKADGPRAQKIKQVEDLAKEAAQSGAVIFTDYRGLTVAEMAELRRRLFELGADLHVVKNTLLRLALEKADLQDGELEGPTAAMFSRTADPIESTKVLVLFLKEKGKGAVKFGFFSAKGGSASGGEKALVEAARIADLAAIPGKAVLQARLVFQLSSPLFKLAYVLSSQQKKLVMVLDQIAKTKGGESK